MYKIRIHRNGIYAVVDVVGQTEKLAANWKQLQPAAKEAIRANSNGAGKHRPGLHDCPAELAAQAR